MDYYFERYGDLELHRRMVGDRPRTEAFARAIHELVDENTRVLDVGTGTGILAMIAARAGAPSVVGIDMAEVAQTAANLVKLNGLGDRVKILRGPAAEVELEEPVDLVVSEWLGHFAFVEAMLEDVLAARDRNLKPGGRLCPFRVETKLAPLDEPILYGAEGPGFWRDAIEGIDFSSLENLELAQGRSLQIRVEPQGLLDEGQSLVALDLDRAKPEDAWQSGEVSFSAQRDGVLNGFVAWFTAELSPGVTLDTSPRHPETHWAQTYLAFPPRPVRAGESIRVGFSIARDEKEARHVRLRLTESERSQSFLLE